MNLYLFLFNDGYHSKILAHDKKYSQDDLRELLKEKYDYRHDDLEELKQLGFYEVDYTSYDPM